ncbi:glycosyltransferase [Burkholderia oklahomensis]|uniref:glycosyltransferase n=1 Tax=Burkholderia oklahomensis TaxID=342113 RepID=UPI00016A972F|nr:glycosyltransferase [Burkholderia oklahomensis]AJX33086.1 glycosyl transferases group 1 family protein [Burkholderia oklahomensis C6786]AOI46643.1 glycosyltransferase [Burkholderia oklahomensis C6786]KUY62819.1 glycosyltransferase [Burkholderia oklahomensis C6786]MBI0360726.1 glycosyltransferase [Burkholderia oklahomensis]SUW60102.1 GDP-mannose-dependent alpha-(1-2)-phosphatidylinositol mannosyltransferase [Burkholderia oklahomensis]
MTAPAAPATAAASSTHVAHTSARRVRILFHIDDFGKGGTETALLAWLNTLDRSAFEIGLSVTYPTPDLATWCAKAIPSDVALHVLTPERWMHALHQRERVRKLRGGEKLLHKASTHALIRPLVARRFLRLARGYDVVCDFDFSLRRIAGQGGARWIGVSHYSFAARFGDKSASYMARRIGQYERYAAFAVLTPDMRREAERLFASTRVAVTELPNVIDPLALRARAAEPAELPAGRFIVSVARLDEGQKDHRTLLRAYAKVRARRADAPRLVLVGDGPDRRVLEQLADELGLGDAVQFAGFCANPFPSVRAADMLILSSRYEGLPMVLGEAMALGTPVISTDCPTGPRDQLDGGRGGLLVPPGDADALADAIERMLADDALRAALVAHASHKIESFGPRAANARMQALVAKLLESA